MLSLSPFSYAEHLSKYHNSPSKYRCFVKLKYYLYEAFIFFSMSRVIILCYYVLKSVPEDESKSQSTFLYVFGYQLLEKNVNIWTSFVCFLIYERELCDMCLNSFSKYGDPFFKEFRFWNTYMKSRNLNYKLFRDNQKYNEIMLPVGKKIVPFLKNSQRLKLFSMIIIIDKCIEFVFKVYRKF